MKLEDLRPLAKRGKLPGRKGKDTYMYQKVILILNKLFLEDSFQNDVEQVLKVKFILQEMVEGVDFISDEKQEYWVIGISFLYFRIPLLTKLELELPPPTYGLNVHVNSLQKAKLCYFGREVFFQTKMMINSIYAGCVANSKCSFRFYINFSSVLWIFDLNRLD